MSELNNQINELRTLKKSYSDLADKVLPVSALLTELNNGKQEMVDALAMKNVQSSTDKTLSAIASDIRSIAQSPITMSGAHVYENQLFGAPTDMEIPYHQPNSSRWNLYKVMTDLLTDGRFVTAGGIVLGLYYKDSDSITLDSVGAGGAYLTSDGAYYEQDIIHVWNDMHDGKDNRWVAYIFASEWHNFTIKQEVLIHIGRKVGTIEFTSESNSLSDIVVTDGNKLKSINNNLKSLGIDAPNIVLINIEEYVASSTYTGLLRNVNQCYGCYIQINKLRGPIMMNYENNTKNNLRTVKIECPDIEYQLFASESSNFHKLYKLEISTKSMYSTFFGIAAYKMPALKYIIINGWEEGELVSYGGTFSSLSHVYIGYGENDKTKSVVFSIKPATPLEKIELQSGWNKPFSVYYSVNKYFINTLTEGGIVDGILKNLKQDEEMCGSGVTITLGATNLAKLTSEEAVALLDSLTNTYGYTFA